jgi:hypothetical protein
MSRWAEKLAAVTPLSWRPRRNSRVFALLPRLARLSLLALAVSTLPSCLVDDPPPYAAPKQTPPRLDTVKALPLMNQILVANKGESIPFLIPVESEDAGQKLSCLLFLDYTGSGGWDRLDGTPLAPATLDDPPRTISLHWDVPNSIVAGCHRITLRVTHEPNLNVNDFPSVYDTHDLAEAYWWANVGVDAASAGLLKDCKDPVGTSP